MNKATYLKSIMEDIRNGEMVLRCVICGEDDPVVLQGHHISGRANSEKKAMHCLNCHTKITYEQNKVPREFRSKDASDLKKIAYQLVTIGAWLREVGKQLIKVGHGLINYVQNCN